MYLVSSKPLLSLIQLGIDITKVLHCLPLLLVLRVKKHITSKEVVSILWQESQGRPVDLREEPVKAIIVHSSLYANTFYY